jgi:hypothetical protein
VVVLFEIAIGRRVVLFRGGTIIVVVVFVIVLMPSINCDWTSRRLIPRGHNYCSCFICNSFDADDQLRFHFASSYSEGAQLL